MKKQTTIRMSAATRAKLDELTAHHGTQTEVIAVAIDRLYREEVIQMTGEQLFDLFVAPGVTAAEIAKMSVGTLTHQIREMRDDQDDDILMSDRQIAVAILEYAKRA